MRAFVILATLLLVGILGDALAADPPSVSFQREILPLLSDRCLICHGPDEATREGGLRLDLAEGATAELDSGGRAIVPGDLDASGLVQRITTSNPGERMPPEGSGKTLSAEEIELLKRWVAEGAHYEQHWAFTRITRPAIPHVARKDWVRNPIDQFTLAKMEAAGVGPSEPAPRNKLVRRMHFDLVGIPPTPQEIDTFVADGSPGAVERLFDQLLASPHYGERQAIDWLDGARYADSNGYQNDFARHMWPWRDWVIEAFNRKMPFDQFAIEQLAGDLLPEPTRDQRVATGFNRNNRTVTEAGSIPEEWLVENMVDRVETTSGVFLGLTMGCARCHDHKYDPVSQQEFYEFYAFFHRLAEQGVYTEQRGNVAPIIQVPSPEQESQRASLETEQQQIKPEADALLAKVAEREDWTQRFAQPGEIPTAAWRVGFEGDKVKGTSASGQTLDATGNQGDNAPGAVGPSRRFHNGGCEIAEVFAPEHNLPFTWSVWLKPEQGGTLLSKTSGDFKRGLDALLDSEQKLGVRLFHTWPDKVLRVVTREPLTAGRWSHVAVVYDGSSQASGIAIYVNGHPVELEVTHDTLEGSIAAEGPLRIAHGPDGAHLVGSLADLRLFDRPLEADEVGALARQALQEQVLARFDQLDDDMKTEGLVLCGHVLREGVPFEYARLADRQYALAKELERLNAEIPTTMVMEDLAEPRPTYVLTRGAYDAADKSRPVSPDVPDFLPSLPEGEPRNRLTLARWIVSRDNPLTARVTVNRMWTRFFGQGLVKSAENFGVQSEAPSHPELLDWLATELIESGWNLQHIERLIVTSATYAQSSQTSPEAYARDPENRLLARGPRHRLPAELVRDNALATSGLLTREIGGRSIMPYQPEKLWEELAGGAFEVYTQDHGPLLYRRSLYVYRKRTVPHPTMGTFDAPSWEVCSLKRPTTDTPLQALALLNDVTYVEAARKLAERMMREGGSQPSERLAWAFRLVTGRAATASELDILNRGLEKYTAEFETNEGDAKALLAYGEAPVAEDLPPRELAAYTSVATLLLNLDEAITKD